MGSRPERPDGRPYSGGADPGPGTDQSPSTARQLGTRLPVRMCVRCQVTTETPVVVCVVHQNSGPGFTVYACRACAPHFPLADVPASAGGER